jgi:hypothetical protein
MLTCGYVRQHVLFERRKRCGSKAAKTYTNTSPTPLSNATPPGVATSIAQEVLINCLYNILEDISNTI